MTGKYGQGTDNIIEAVIITPTGEVLTANECQNEDIIWAIRGGGGGTFGVILSATVKAYPIPSMELTSFDVMAKNSIKYQGLVAIRCSYSPGTTRIARLRSPRILCDGRTSDGLVWFFSALRRTQWNDQSASQAF